MTRHDLGGRYGPPGHILLGSLTRAMKLVVGGPPIYRQSHAFSRLCTQKDLHNSLMACSVLYTAFTPARSLSLSCLARHKSTVVENPNKRKQGSPVNKVRNFWRGSNGSNRTSRTFFSKYLAPPQRNEKQSPIFRASVSQSPRHQIRIRLGEKAEST